MPRAYPAPASPPRSPISYEAVVGRLRDEGMGKESSKQGDEDVEPLMDYDDIQMDGEQPQDPQQHDHFLDDNLEGDIGKEDGRGINLRNWEQSPIRGYECGTVEGEAGWR
ncbi:hypothetical protein MLD38_018313 [Melastoma candidum]|uniref:Uncharacterized protein n=1 Tax=Melastoma candidum TaxID=119954 RepID=A0ACB9QTZ4_9MYRT|nr:hypothetical protein MLD38_018313 [Melastoma candidum]